MKTEEANWYAYPRYYDIAFQADTQLEADFIEGASKQFGLPKAKRILEPGCGSGRLVREMARRGYDVTGFDLCAASIDYLKEELKHAKQKADVFVGDMTDFTLKQPVDIAYNFCNTFRHLQTAEAARSHLQSVAKALRTGGIYLLGLHVMPPDADFEDTERWQETSGETTVTCTFKVLSTDWPNRQEVLRTVLSARGPEGEFRVRTDYPMRMYTAEELKELVEGVDGLEIAGVFDFWYDLEFPRELDDEISDCVLVLRKK
jgi:SAM-dependent methyltransferase